MLTDISRFKTSYHNEFISENQIENLMEHNENHMILKMCALSIGFNFNCTQMRFQLIIDSLHEL